MAIRTNPSSLSLGAAVIGGETPPLTFTLYDDDPTLLHRGDFTITLAGVSPSRIDLSGDGGSTWAGYGNPLMLSSVIINSVGLNLAIKARAISGDTDAVASAQLILVQGGETAAVIPLTIGASGASAATATIGGIAQITESAAGAGAASASLGGVGSIGPASGTGEGTAAAVIGEAEAITQAAAGAGTAASVVTAPAYVTANLVADYQAALVTGSAPGTNGSSQPTWADLSGNGRTLQGSNFPNPLTTANGWATSPDRFVSPGATTGGIFSRTDSAFDLTGDFALEFWLNPAVSSGTNQYLAGKESGNNTAWYLDTYNSMGRPRLSLGNGSALKVWDGPSSTLPNSAMANMLLGWDNTNHIPRLWINGVAKVAWNAIATQPPAWVSNGGANTYGRSTYAVGDLVGYNSHAYCCKADHTSGSTTPNNDSTNWQDCGTGAVAWAGTRQTNASAFLLGAVTSATYGWKGAIAQFRAYSALLTQAQVTQNFNAFKSLYGL